jgi:hypothetical protein
VRTGARETPRKRPEPARATERPSATPVRAAPEVEPVGTATRAARVTVPTVLVLAGSSDRGAREIAVELERRQIRTVIRSPQDPALEVRIASNRHGDAEVGICDKTVGRIQGVVNRGGGLSTRPS